MADKNSQIAKEQSQADAARDFVNKETLAEYWHAGDPRYMACMRDLDAVIPEDGQTYATSLDIKAQTPSLSSQGNQPARCARGQAPTTCGYCSSPFRATRPTWKASPPWRIG